ncbi:MAG TPA: protein kinase [Polyangiaceae bacterium]|nr:protein kinase [Polyangiaceae bacterium]
MVWPPPKVLKSPEGELTVERPQGDPSEVSTVVSGVEPETHQREALPREALPREALQHDDGESYEEASPEPLLPHGSPLEALRAGAPPMPGATVSVMAATAVPRDWLERPEGLLGCVLGSRYRIVGVIGRGPMGIACEGESSRGRQVTLKLLPRAPELPVEHFAWQLRQALALAHFDHPNVTPISDFGALEDGGAFVSRSRVPGVTLRTILRQGALPLARSLDIARQIAGALAAGHAQDIAHGRLKPENIVVHGGARPGDVIKVVDFGMAGLPVNLRAVAPSENEARRLALRTRLYLPADLTGASPAVDIFSLGVILFEMIAGQPPFAFDAPPPPGSEPAPLAFAQIDPSLVVPASVNELVFALLHPKALEHGLHAARVGEMLDGLLGRPSVSPTAEPVTSQIQSAPLRELHTDAQTSKVQAPDVQAFTASAGAIVWPVSPAPAPARPHSFPPLPQGFVSTFPPASVEAALAASQAPPASAAAVADARDSVLPRSGPPPMPATSPSLPPTPPSRRGSMPYPPPPSSRRQPTTTDEPFATPSFPPPQVNIPQAPPSPNISIAQGTAASSLPPAAGADDIEEMELRPSFIGRLKRIFGKKRPDEF